MKGIMKLGPGTSGSTYVRDNWIEVDIGVSTLVAGVITQGGVSFRVTQYRVRYKKLPSSDFDDVIHRNGSIKVFEGNIQDARTPVTNMFDQSIVATIVRILPVAYKHGICLRLEMLGCQTKVK
ncbi:lactadherin-like [Asterias amurensis]|uniref:lactadherin-like n=1 Tax=Asterias amurensis TaxID=7602 RepID=UPI003AB29DEA